MFCSVSSNTDCSNSSLSRYSFMNLWTIVPCSFWLIMLNKDVITRFHSSLPSDNRELSESVYFDSFGGDSGSLSPASDESSDIVYFSFVEERVRTLRVKGVWNKAFTGVSREFFLCCSLSCAILFWRSFWRINSANIFFWT